MIKSAGRLQEVISDVKCGIDGTMFLTEMGRLYACGNNQDNKLGLNQRETFIGQMRRILSKTQLQVAQTLVATPIKELGKHRVIDMSLGPTHSCVVVETGRVYTFGRNSEGQLCTGNLLPKNMPSVIKGLPTKPMTATCTELASIVTTEDNSFLVWGSRPIIRSPLTKFLNQQSSSRSSTTSTLKSRSSESVSQKERSNSLKRGESDVFEEEAPAQAAVDSTVLSPTSVDLGSSLQSVSSLSGHIASNEASPERNPSTADSSSAARKTPPKDPLNESLSQSQPKFVLGTVSEPSKEQVPVGGHMNMRRYSSLNLSDTPHHMYPCSSSKDYIDKVSSLLQELSHLLDADKSSRGVSSTVIRTAESASSKEQGQAVSGGSKANKRIYTSNSSEVVMMDGIIMKPTSIDLVGRSGLLSTLSVQGLTSAKLEGVSCFGCNVLILIEAQVMLNTEGKEGATQQRVSTTTKIMQQPRLVLGRKLTEKGALRRRKILSPNFSPLLERKAGVDQSTASFAEPVRPLGISHSNALTAIQQSTNVSSGKTETEEEENASDDEAPTWLQKEFELAVALQDSGNQKQFGRLSRTSIESDVLPMFDPTNIRSRSRDDGVQPPKLFAPTPASTPSPEILVTNPQVKKASQENLTSDVTYSVEKEKRTSLRSQQIRLEPVRMPIPRLQSATSTSSLPSTEDASTTNLSQGKKPNVLTLKKALSNVDVAPGSSQAKPKLNSKQQSQSMIRAPSKVPALQKAIPPQISSPVRRTSSSNSVKNSSPSPSCSPRRGSEQCVSPVGSVSGNPQTPNPRASPSEGSEVGSDRDICSPTPSSSSDGEVFVKVSSKQGHLSHKRTKTTPGPINKIVSKQAAFSTGHAIPVTTISPYADSVSKTQRGSNKSLSTPKGSGSKIQTGTGQHQLQKKNSAALVLEKQLNEAKQQAEKKVKIETEKILQEKKKVEEKFERERQELEKKALEQQKQAVQREEELTNIIEQLKSDLAKQNSALQENTDMVKSLQQKVEQLPKSPSSPSTRKHFRLRNRSARGSKNSEGGENKKSSTGSRTTKSRVCVIS